MNHLGVGWALAGGVGKLGDTALEDLSDPISVKQTLISILIRCYRPSTGNYSGRLNRAATKCSCREHYAGTAHNSNDNELELKFHIY